MNNPQADVELQVFRGKPQPPSNIIECACGRAPERPCFQCQFFRDFPRPMHWFLLVLAFLVSVVLLTLSVD